MAGDGSKGDEKDEEDEGRGRRTMSKCDYVNGQEREVKFVDEFEHGSCFIETPRLPNG